METNQQLFKRAFAHLYFLMLSADMVADLRELELGNKLIELEGLDRGDIMKEIDILSGSTRETVFDNAIKLLQELDAESQLKCLAYTKMMSAADGDVDEKENQLLSDIYSHEMKVSEQDVFKFEIELENRLLDK